MGDLVGSNNSDDALGHTSSLENDHNAILICTGANACGKVKTPATLKNSYVDHDSEQSVYLKQVRTPCPKYATALFTTPQVALIHYMAQVCLD